MIEVSVVVPTLNEERFLPRLLASLEAQSFGDYEVIVADAGSSDSTKNVAQAHHTLIVDGGSPAVGRNSGARSASGRFIFFLDADVVLPSMFLQNAVNEIHRRDISLCTCRVIPISNSCVDRIIHILMNYFVRLLAPIWPKAPGYAIFVARWLFEETGGFDESLTLCEDVNFVERAAHHRALRYLTSVRLWVDTRRYRYEGRLRYVLRSVAMNTYRMFIGEIRDMRFRYDFGVFGRG